MEMWGGKLGDIVNLGELWKNMESGGTRRSIPGGTAQGDPRCVTFNTE